MIDIIIIVAIVIGLVLSVGVIIAGNLRYKHNIIIREIVNNSVLVFKDKFRLYKETDGTVWWRLQKEKDKSKKLIQIFPNESINIDNKGRYFCEAWRINTHYIPVIDKAPVSELPKELLKIPDEIKNINNPTERDKKAELYKKKVIDEWKEKKGIKEAFTPYSSQQRALLVANHRKAEERKGKNWTENIPMFVSIGAAVMLVVCLMIFWGDIAKPALESKAMTANIISEQKATAEILRDIDRNIQTLNTEMGQVQKKIVENKAPN